MRTGVIAKKIGMSRMFVDGEFVPVSLLHLDNCFVVGHKTQDRDGYTALQMGFGVKKRKNVSKPLLGIFDKINCEPTQKIVEFRVDTDQMIDIGSEVNATHFSVGQVVDVSGVSIGKGFAGVIKRHNFRSLRATHGVSLTHRSHGSTGGRQDPGKVFKGKKMAGQLGNTRVTVQNLQIIGINEEDNYLIVKGAVPGHKGTFLEIRDAIKKQKIV